MGAIASIAAPIAGAVLGGIGGAKSSGGGTTTTSSSSAPWQPQQQYLTQGFGAASTALNNALANPVYQGQRVADLNGFQTSGANQAGGFATNNFGQAQNLTNIAGGLVNSGASFGSNAQNIYNQYAAGIDPTQQILANANQYASNPYIDGLIDASGRDLTRQLNEQTLPTLNRQFAGTGNTNSTRAGVESAIAQRGAADRLADMSSQIRSQFFGKGLDLSQNQYNQNLTNSLQANRGLLDSYNAGNNGLNNGADLANSYFNMANDAGSVFQNQDQNRLNANMAQFNEQNQNPLKYINQYMQAVDGNYGGTSSGTSTAPKTGGGWQGAITGVLGGGLGGLGAASQAKKAGLFD